MTESDPSSNREPEDPRFGDDDDAAIDDALAALTAQATLAGATLDDEDDDVAEDDVGEGAFLDEPDEDGAGLAGVPDDDAADDLLGDMEGASFAEADDGLSPIHFAEPGAEDEEPFAEPVAAMTPAPSRSERERIRRLEELARALTVAEVTRESGRVRRKVSASATGAAAVGAVPVILQLVGALDLSPELAATVAAGASTLAAFASGYFTPERKPKLPPGLVQDALRRR